jgi:cobalt/nickel transport protein
LGVLVTFAIGAGVFWLVRRRGAGTPDDGDEADSGADAGKAKAGSGGS